MSKEPESRAHRLQCEMRKWYGGRSDLSDELLKQMAEKWTVEIGIDYPQSRLRDIEDEQADALRLIVHGYTLRKEELRALKRELPSTVDTFDGPIEVTGYAPTV